jgi:hypothetical protein
MWQAAWVDAWTIGLIALVVVGLGLILFGALHDRAKNRRLAAEMLAPPKRSIPQFTPQTTGPRYLSDLQARRPPSEPLELSRSDRETIAVQLTSSDTTTIAAGYASKDFITDRASGWAVLEAPAILVCEDAVDSIRELLPILEKLIVTRTPLVIVAPAIASEVRTTLEVNTIRRIMSLLAVEVPEEASRRVLAEATAATATDRSDRQAGYLPLDHLGRCERLVATATTTYLIRNATRPVA